MMFNPKYLWPIVGIFASLAASPYELTTHSLITVSAISKSVIFKDATLAKDLGLDLSQNGVIASGYFDVSGISRQPRRPWEFEQRFVQDDIGQLSVPGWIVRGAIREDDLTVGGCIVNATAAWVHGRDTPLCNPQDDPYSNFDRVTQHFFNPLDRSGLRMLGQESVHAVNWATGSVNAFASPPVADQTRRNHFSIADARNAMYFALSGKDVTGSLLREEERSFYWATAFRALGDVSHLLQDMAQPQHTRSEGHPGSTLEYYIEERARGNRIQALDGSGTITPPALTLGDYPAPRFSSFVAYWGSLNVNPFAGTGLADYSNRSFFTEKKNFGSRGALQLAGPSSNRADYSEQLVSVSALGYPGYTVRSLLAPVADPLSTTSDPIRMTTEGAFAAFGKTIRKYSLNFSNFDDQVGLLLPRAVAYTTGLIDYFFRGRIDCTYSPTLPTGCIVRNMSEESMTGAVELYYDATDGMRYPVPNAQWQVDNLLPYKTNAGAGLSIQFVAPTSPPPASPGEYVLVFHGTLGDEKAEGGFIGSVAAKIIGANSGALYVLGLTSQGQLLTYVTDSLGTRPLDGKAYDPLKPWYEYHRNFFGVYRRYQTPPRAYTTRQVRFGEGVFANNYYLPSVRMTAGGIPFTMIRTDLTGPLQYRKYPGYQWLAESGDPGLGKFVFNISGSRQLAYERTFSDGGVTKVVSGTVNYSSTVNDPDLSTSVISGDGLTLGEMGVSTSSGGGSGGCVKTITSGSTMTYFDMRIAIAAVPTVSFQQLDAGSSNSTTVQTFQVGSDGTCGVLIDQTSSSTSTAKKPVGYVRNVRERFTQTSSGTSSGIGCLYPGNWLTTSAASTWQLSGGGGSTSAQSTCSSSGPSSTVSGLAPSFMLDGNPANAIMFDLASNQSSFRGIALTGVAYVHDVSPLGEVFFAFSDGSGVVHEPTGNRPRYVNPADVIQILNAMWF